MKYLSVVVPCYNSEDYMHYCIESLLTGGEDVEILIINDGSSDNTESIAKEYEKKYPTIIRAISQVNKGHGGALNTGIENAEGLYLKVVDSDDWVDVRAYLKVIAAIKSFENEGSSPDLIITNYVYENDTSRFKKIMSYHKILKENEIFTWEDIAKLKIGKYMLMHTLMYKTKVLKSMDFKLPEHTFYVDNLFAFIPLINVQTMYYMNVNLYCYLIGREGQSVNEQIMIKRIDQQIRVNKLMLEHYCDSDIKSEAVAKYMLHYLEIVTAISSILLIKSKTKENLKKKKELWKFIKSKNPKLYKQLNKKLVVSSISLPGVLGRRIALIVYGLAQRIFGFN